MVERLLRIAKPKLFMLPWFRKLWDGFLSLREKAIGWISPRPLKPHARRIAKASGPHLQTLCH